MSQPVVCGRVRGDTWPYMHRPPHLFPVWAHSGKPTTLYGPYDTRCAPGPGPGSVTLQQKAPAERAQEPPASQCRLQGRRRCTVVPAQSRLETSCTCLALATGCAASCTAFCWNHSGWHAAPCGPSCVDGSPKHSNSKAQQLQSTATSRSPVHHNQPDITSRKESDMNI